MATWTGAGLSNRGDLGGLTQLGKLGGWSSGRLWVGLGEDHDQVERSNKIARPQRGSFPTWCVPSRAKGDTRWQVPQLPHQGYIEHEGQNLWMGGLSHC